MTSIKPNEYIFIGYSEDTDFQKHIVSRTNKNAISFIQKLFPNAWDWGKRTISLSLSAAVSNNDCDRILECLKSLLRK